MGAGHAQGAGSREQAPQSALTLAEGYQQWHEAQQHTDDWDSYAAACQANREASGAADSIADAMDSGEPIIQLATVADLQLLELARGLNPKPYKSRRPVALLTGGSENAQLPIPMRSPEDRMRLLQEVQASINAAGVKLPEC